MKKFRVYEYYSGPWHNPYVCTCKSLENAKAAIVRRANSCSPHSITKISETEFVAVSLSNSDWKTKYCIEIVK